LYHKREPRVSGASQKPRAARLLHTFSGRK
jgi:hypothetical protein